MEDEFSVDLITLIDEDGKEHEFEVLDVLEQDDRVFYALLPVYETSEDLIDDDSVYYIFEEKDNESDEPLLVEIEDEDLLDKLAEIFEERFNELYEDEE